MICRDGRGRVEVRDINGSMNGKRFESVTLTEMDLIALANTDPRHLYEKILRLRTRFMPQPNGMDFQDKLALEVFDIIPTDKGGIFEERPPMYTLDTSGPVTITPPLTPEPGEPESAYDRHKKFMGDL